MSLQGEIKKVINKVKTAINHSPKIKIPKEFYNRPQLLKIEQTNACNSRCNFCAYKKMTRPKVNMDEKMFDKVVEDYVKIGGGSVGIFPIVGEALLNRNTIKYVKKLKENPKTPHIIFYTNLTLLSSYTEEEIDTLLSSIDFLGVSAGANKEDYLASFGIDGFDKLVEGTECLVRYKEKYGTLPETLFMGRSIKKAPEVDAHLAEMVSYLTDKPFEWIQYYLDWSGDIEDFGQEQSIIKIDRTNQKLATCKIGLFGSVVFSNGDVGFCPCSDTHAKLLIGNVNENSLQEIFAGEKRRKFIDSFEKGTMHPHCAKCGFYQAITKEDLLNPILLA